jgi:EAL domain-containing protein (putative c-di-GMP-specific phosphodiesterase class I)
MAAALAQRTIGVSFTPVMELASGHVTGCIAAPYCHRTAAGHIEGVALLELAESFNLAAPLAEAAIDRALLACRAMTGMPDDFAIAVDASAFLAADADAVAKIDHMMQLHGVAAGRLTLMVQQDMLAAHHERVLDALVRLNIKGAGAVLTDFGSAPVVFAAIGRLPVGRLALAPALVAALPTSDDARKAVRAIAAMAHAFGLRVIAPFVDQAVLVPLLREAGCDEAYGAAIAPRADVGQMPSVIEAWRGAMMPRAVNA